MVSAADVASSRSTGHRYGRSPDNDDTTTRRQRNDDERLLLGIVHGGKTKTITYTRRIFGFRPFFLFSH